MTTPADKPIQIPAQLILDLVKNLILASRISMSRMIAFDYGIKTDLRNFNRGNASTRSKYEISFRLHEECRTAIVDATILDRNSYVLAELWRIGGAEGIYFADHLDKDTYAYAVGQIQMKPQTDRIKERIQDLDPITSFHRSIDPTTL
jgi:hypothetical protein